jgi:hypothetical protein
MRGRSAAALTAMVLAVGLVLAGCSDTGAHPAPGRAHIPTLAYYYQWFTPSSWDRAKVDYPLVGRYSSDDEAVMRRQIAQAKAAGIDGFIVSWKDLPVNNRRLEALMTVARPMGFKLAVIYEGLNFGRAPLPARKVDADLQMFLREYAADPVFRIFDKPLVIWSGTWKFSAGDIERVTRPLRRSLLVLASEKSPQGYARVARSVDGDAYYWSSVDPAANSGYPARLAAMSDTVHRSGGRWIAPFAPGFDARLVGGTREVPRRDGVTLRQEYAAAVSSSPDALGLISWNEFSENTHVEPSRKNGDQYLTVLSALSRGGEVPASPLAEDSSAAAGGGGSMTELLALGGFALLLLLLAGVRYARRDTTGQAPAPAAPYGPAKPPRRRLASYLTWRRVTALGVVAGVVVTGATVDTVRRAPDGPDRRTPLYLGAQPVKVGGSAVVAAAGDIACPADKALLEEERTRPDSCRTELTAALLTSVSPDAVLPLGDNQYPAGTLKDFLVSYDKTWGAFRKITYPVPGNHEYGTPGATGYFSYFGARAGEPGKGYYSYDLGAWHVVALNSECQSVGGCGADSPQATWLKQDLAAHPRACTMAYWHRPRFSSGTHGNNLDNDPLWRILAAARADLVLGGHDHDYERFAPLDAAGRPDAAHGMTEFVVGTGGDSHYKLQLPDVGSDLRLKGHYGVLRLQLTDGAFSWKFLTVPNGAVADAGTTTCR